MDDGHLCFWVPWQGRYSLVFLFIHFYLFLFSFSTRGKTFVHAHTCMKQGSGTPMCAGWMAFVGRGHSLCFLSWRRELKKIEEKSGCQREIESFDECAVAFYIPFVFAFAI